METSESVKNVVETPKPNNFTKSKYFKPALIIASIVAVIVILAFALLISQQSNNQASIKDNSQNNQQSNTNNQEVMDNREYSTTVCPDHIEYGPQIKATWDGVTYDVDLRDIEWFDSCKNQIQSEPNASKWQFDNGVWEFTGENASVCPEPIFENSPVDVSLATSILYPGQTRGQYKPHGGFRFDNQVNNDVTIRLPMDAKIVSGVRYLEAGEIQYLFDFENDCGIAIRFDHLLKLSPEFQVIADTLPEPNTETKGTPIDPKAFEAGTIVATSIGMANTRNVGVDFGVYDYRKQNQASESATYRVQHENFSSQAFYAVCWLDWLPNGDDVIAKSLPGGDGKAGKQSDYCN